MKFSRADGERIATKLSAEVRRGGSHDKVIVRHDGRWIAMFGLRRDASACHNYIPKQLLISPQQCRDLANCPLSAEAYFELLQRKGKL